MKISIISCGFSLGLISTSVNARPLECSQAPYSKIYETAVQERVDELARAWRKSFHRDCDRQVDFEAVYSTPITEGGPPLRKCKNAGINEGTQTVLDNISEQCSHEGHQAGAEDGRTYGREYCSLSSLVPEGDFEINFEESCKDVFIRYANKRCPAKKNGDSNFYEVVEDKCSLNK